MLREATLFAAVGFLVGGIDDLAIDLVYLARYFRRRLTGATDTRLDSLPPAQLAFAVFVPAWHEEAVIADMLRMMLARWDTPLLRVYVGVYPNDAATIRAVEAVAADDPRVHIARNRRSGPTTKADNLNSCWRAMLADETAGDLGVAAVILHDAEDVVHAGELAVYADALSRSDAVQIPVAPLVDINSRFVGGCYLDEFAEAHGKSMIVRQVLGAGLPFAGTGCAIRRAMLARIAELRSGDPFDADSLTEDYELGLTISGLGGKTEFGWVVEADGRTPVAVRAYFPGRFDAAVRQKARWMVGIALAGWDRVGWSRPMALAEHWMRMRDRRAPIAVLVLFVAYCAFALWAVSFVAHALTDGVRPSVGDGLELILILNATMLGWRIAMRITFAANAAGWREGLRAVPRIVVGNLIAMAAVQRALVRYATMLRGGAPQWEKTAHHFPSSIA